LAVIFVVIFLVKNTVREISFLGTSEESKFGKLLSTIQPTPTATPTPTPKPLTFAEMNERYGPCVRLPVLMYHHVQSEESAKANKQTSLTVNTDIFEKQMQYLSDKGYHVAAMSDLINFFDNGTPILPKSILITFDDGYEDNYSDAFFILQKFGFPATIFISTGLVGNPGYLSWDKITSMNGLIYFANHTWSHKNVKTTASDMEYEISTANTQLIDHGLNSQKVFAYPYGLDSAASEKYLTLLGYKAAFTTISGNTLCAKQRLSLPRIRIGNTNISSYGF
jgi:peptidoglycan/xylan/chitin deacetylase (PgdA/CDA1 family)